MRNAKKTLSLVMIAIFTTFIVLSGIPAGAVTTAQAKAQVSKATAAVVKVETTVKVATFNPTTALAQYQAAGKEVAKVRGLGKSYTKTYTAIYSRLTVVSKKIAARKAAIAALEKALAKKFADATAAVEALERAVDPDNVDLVGDAAALADAQGAVTAALEMIEQLDKESANYKGLMARVDLANSQVVKAMEEIAANEAQAAADAAKKEAEAAAAKAETDAQTAAETAVKAVEDAVAAGNLTVDTAAAQTAIDAVKTVEVKAGFQTRLTAAIAKTQPAVIKTVTAVDGTITVNFDKKPITTVAAANFTVTKTVTTTAAVTSSVTPTGFTVVSDTAVTLAVPAVEPATTEQSVVYSVTYLSTGAAVAAPAYAVAKLPAVTVASVSATNLKEIVVTFTEKVDATTAETLSNYTLDSYTWTTDNATATLNDAAVLQADGKTVVITLKNGSELTQQSSHTLVVAGVKSAASAVANVSQSLTFVALDLAVPTANSVTVTGPKALRVTFSEPVNPAALGTFALDSNMYSTTVDGVGTDNRTVDITVGTTLPTGSHTLTVTGTKDYTNVFTVASTTLTFNYAVNTTLPTVTATTVKQNSVVLTFSKAITAATQGFVSVYHTYNNVAGYVGAKSWSTDGTTLTVTFAANYLPIGAATLYVNNGADTTNVAKDEWGNVFASATLPVTVVADLTAPTVSSVAFVDSTHLDVTFSEAVTGVVASAFTLKNAAGTSTLTVSGVTATSTSVYRLTTTAMNGDTYVLSIAGGVISDASVNLNKLVAYTNTFVVSDTLTPVASAAIANLAGATATKVKVMFNKVMATSGTGSVLTASNYMLAGAALPSTATLATADGGKSVIITLPAGTYAGKVLTMGKLADYIGNFTTGFSAALTITADDVLLANLVNYKAINTTQVTFEVLAPLTAIDRTKFTVGGTNPTSVTYVNQLVDDGATNGSLVTLTFATPWNTDAPPTVTVTGTGAMTTSFGTTNSAGYAIATVDSMAPALVATTGAQVTGPNEITLTYTEDLKATSVGLYTYTVAGNTVTAVNLAGNVVTLTLGTALGTAATASVTQALPIQDDLGTSANTLAASTTAFTATDAQAPTGALTFTKAGAPVTIVKAGDEVLVTATFSEALLDTPVVKIAGAGGNVIAATNMTKVSTTVYTYTWTVGAGDAAETFTFSVGTDANAIAITGAPTSGTITVDNTAPTVTKLGTGTAVTINALATATITFNEALDTASKAAVEAALSAESANDGTYSWDAANKVLTITGGAGNTVYNADVTVPVTDLVGNTSAPLVIVDAN